MTAPEASRPAPAPGDPHPTVELKSPEPGVPAPAPAPGMAVRPDVVAFRKVTKCFGEGPDAKVAIQDVSFVVEDAPDRGELVTIVGPSGCGKSTILRTIAGLKPHFPPTSGEALVFGKPVEEPGPDRGLVDQKYSLLPHLNVLDNIAFGLRLRGMPRSERLDRAREWVKKVGLEGSERKYPSELSGGMQQRVATDGRAVRRAGPGDSAPHAGTAHPALERATGHRLPGDALGRGSGLSRGPRVFDGGQPGTVGGRVEGAAAGRVARGEPAQAVVCEFLPDAVAAAGGCLGRAFRVEGVTGAGAGSSAPPPRGLAGDMNE